MRDEANRGLNIVGVLLCFVLRQGSVDLLNFGCVPGGEEICGGLWGFSEEDDACSGSAEAMHRVCVGALGLYQVQERVLHEAAAGEGGQAARFVNRQEICIFPEDFKVLGGVWFDPGGAVPDEGLAESEQFASISGDPVEGDFTVVQFLLPALRAGMRIKSCQVGEEALPVVFAADDCGVGIAPVEH